MGSAAAAQVARVRRKEYCGSLVVSGWSGGEVGQATEAPSWVVVDIVVSRSAGWEVSGTFSTLGTGRGLRVV
jgi:hypothetical protein